MQIPLLAVVCVQIWYEGKQVGDSMTSFYAAMLNMLVEREDQNHNIQREHDESLRNELPGIFSKYLHIEKCIAVLLKLGKVAYDGLSSNETNLVFQKVEIEKRIGLKELQFALDVGLISQKEANSLFTRNVSVNFFHKSIQEFLAAIYIVSSKMVSESFCEHLSNIKVIMELSNVIMFICGMCPSLGSVISQCVVRVTDSDTEICKYRDSPDNTYSTVKELYNIQTSWYREIQYGQTDSPVTFHVSDVYLDTDESDIEQFQMTKEILCDHHVNKRSLYLNRVRTDKQRCISNAVLNDFLSNKFSTRSLMLFIDGSLIDRRLHLNGIPSLRTLYLSSVKINNNDDSDGHVYPPLLTDMISLRVLKLDGVDLDNEGLWLSDDIVHIEKITINGAGWYAKQWEQFVRHLQNMQHRVDVKLRAVNLDGIPLDMLRSSPEFDFTLGPRMSSPFLKYMELIDLSFTRKWPPVNLTQFENE